MKHFTLLSCLLFFTFYAPAKDIQQPKPLSFIENKGQITDQHFKSRKDIDFKLEAPGLNIFVGKGQIHYQWTRSNPDSTITSYRMDVQLAGCNPDALIEIQNAQDYYETYYSSNLPDGAVAHSCNKVVYRNIYPGIDWVLYSKNQTLKYDFVVHQNGDARNIQLVYKGADRLFIENGTLSAATPFGTINEAAPITIDAATRTQVPSAFVLNGNTVSFDVEKNINIVIDPTIAWATYYGGAWSESAAGVKCDNSGNVLMAGSTTSANNIATSGAFQSTLASPSADAYLVKFNAAGIRQWGTYYGDVGSESFMRLCFDAAGNIYASGYTGSSSGIASAGAHQTVFGGLDDCMLVKFTSSGLRLWATYYGGSGHEDFSVYPAVACDASGNVYLSGMSGSSSGIATSGSHQAVYAGNGDGFLAKFDPSGVRQWATYYGGTGGDDVAGIEIDGSNNIYICGDASSTTGIATAGTHKSVSTGGTLSFLAKFSTSGTRQWGTYYGTNLGGPSNTYANHIAVDKKGNPVIMGETLAKFEIASSNAPDTVPSYNFAAKFTPSGLRIWGTYIACGVNDLIDDMDLDSNDNIYITGITDNDNFPSNCNFTNNSIPTSTNVFVHMLDSSGTRIWGTYYGGANLDYGFGISVNKLTNDIYVCGNTFSTTGIATPGSHQSTFGGTSPTVSTSDAFLLKFSADRFVNLALPFTDTLGCAGDTFYARYGVTFPFDVGNTFTIQLSNTAGSFGSPVYLGSAVSVTGGLIRCVIPANTPAGTYNIRIISSSPASVGCDIGRITIGAVPPANLVAGANSPLCVGQNIQLSGSSSSSGITSWQWTGPNNFSSALQNPVITNSAVLNSGVYTLKAGIYGCYSKDTANVVVNIIPAKPLASYNNPVCSGNMLSLSSSSATTGVSYSWSGPASFTSTLQNPAISNSSTAMSGSYVVSAMLNGCTAKDTVVVLINNTPAKPFAGNDTTVCSGGNITLHANTTTSGVTWAWSGPNGFSSGLQNPALTSLTTGFTGDYVVNATLAPCTASDTVHLTVNQTPSIAAASNNGPLCTGGTLNLTASAVPGAAYNWTGPAGFSSASQNPSRPNVTLSYAGVYTVTAVLNNCTSVPVNTTVIINQGPFVNIYPSPNDTVCMGNSVTLVALAANGGSTPQYRWFRNNVFSGITTSSFTVASPANGDQFFCELTNNSTCNTIAIDTSNIIPITVLPVTSPSVTISANPPGPWAPYQLVSFTAAAVNAGSNPHYQWVRNGTNIIGANAALWSAATLTDKDTICVILTSSDLCASPKTIKSNCIDVTILTGIGNIEADKSLQLYPNPNDGRFTLKATAASNEAVTISILNAVGQLVYQDKLLPINQSLSTNLDLSVLPNGVYLLKLSDEVSARTVRFTIER